MKAEGVLMIKKAATFRSKDSVRWLAKGVAPGHNEICLHVKIEIADSLFSRPQLFATVSIDDDSSGKILAEVVSDVEKVMKEKGVTIKIAL